MFGFMLFAFIIIMWAAVNWWLELQPWLKNMRRPKPGYFQLIRRFGCGIINTGRLFTDGKYLMIDLGITVGCTSIFGFGEGVQGGVIGIFVSNCISAIILLIMWKNNKLKKIQLQGA